MQDMDASVDDTHAEKSGLLRNNYDLKRKGSVLGRNGLGGLRGGSLADCFTQHAVISLSKAYWHNTLNNLDKGDLIKML